MTNFTFASTAAAYDTSQYDERIADGDILIVPSEGVVGFLFQAWPVAVTETNGAFHQLAEGATFASLEGGQYAKAAELAQAIAADPTGHVIVDLTDREAIMMYGGEE
jgi:hypothetical protein